MEYLLGNKEYFPGSGKSSLKAGIQTIRWLLNSMMRTR